MLKKMSEAKKYKILKWVEKIMAKGVKDKGRCKKPAMTNNYGTVLKKGR